jgi:nicotinate-nucleotide--dimethylbenzimidazole phosphoribosyltransferase
MWMDEVAATRAGRPASRRSPLAEIPGRLIASHRSAEVGHRVVLEALGLNPLLELGLRLGEGTGAALAIPIVAAAARIIRDMATFEDAGVSNRD